MSGSLEEKHILNFRRICSDVERCWFLFVYFETFEHLLIPVTCALIPRSDEGQQDELLNPADLMNADASDSELLLAFNIFLFIFIP